MKKSCKPAMKKKMSDGVKPIKMAAGGVGKLRKNMPMTKGKSGKK